MTKPLTRLLVAATLAMGIPSLASAAVDPVARSMGARALNILNVLASTQRPLQVDSPTISGTPVVGNILTATTGYYTGSPTFAIQWLRNGTAISGATNLTYLLTSADGGQNVGFQLTATNSVGSNSMLSPTFAISTAVAVSPSLDYSNLINSQYIM